MGLGQLQEISDMALTNAEKQSAHRKRVAEKLAKYEAALEIIAEMAPNYQGAWASERASLALGSSVPSSAWKASSAALNANGNKVAGEP